MHIQTTIQMNYANKNKYANANDANISLKKF